MSARKCRNAIFRYEEIIQEMVPGRNASSGERLHSIIADVSTDKQFANLTN